MYTPNCRGPAVQRPQHATVKAMPKLLTLLCGLHGCLYIPGSAIDARLDTGHARPGSDVDTDADSDADADTDTDTGKDT